jgi:hypothetical protein
MRQVGDLEMCFESLGMQMASWDKFMNLKMHFESLGTNNTPQWQVKWLVVYFMLVYCDISQFIRIGWIHCVNLIYSLFPTMTAFLALNIFFANNAYVATYSEHKYIYSFMFVLC